MANAITGANNSLLILSILLNSVTTIKKRRRGTSNSPLNLFRFSRGSIPIIDEIKAITKNIEREIIIGFKVINGSDFLNLDTNQQKNAAQKVISLGVVV